MPEHQTANRSLPYPSPSGLVDLGADDFRELAEAIDVMPLLKQRDGGTEPTLTGNYDELLRSSHEGVKVKLPSASGEGKGRMFAFLYYNGAGEATIEGGAATIYGNGYVAASTLKLGGGGSIFLISNGTSWIIVGGVMKRGGLDPTLQNEIARAAYARGQTSLGTRLSFGQVNISGGRVGGSSYDSNDWTSEKITETGKYRIKWSPEHNSGVYAFIATPHVELGAVVGYESKTTSGITIQFLTAREGSGINTEFTFMSMGTASS